MKCPRCGHENTVEAKFCDQCAAELARACARCGRPVPTTAKFCAECGYPVKPVVDKPRFAAPRSYTPQHLTGQIPSAGAGIEGERKQVTVLFADIKGSMELFAGRDPEAAQKLFDPVIDSMIEAVHRYEGTVNRVMGDGIMALFGAPIAHEDHAVRACYAALRMQDTITRYSDEIHRSHGLAVEIRVGVNSGEIVVYNDLHMDYTVVGQTANLAARMEQMAKAGSILTTAATFQLAEGYIAMKPLGPMPVRGLTEPVQLYEVTGAGAMRTRLQVAAGRGLTRFVGRELDLEQLHRVQHLAGRGLGQVVAIAGEAGVGKSRLVHEFVHSPHTAEWLVLESRSAPYGRAMPYLPVIELLRDYFKINADDSTRSIREKVTEKILRLDQSLQDAIPPVLDLLDSLEEHHPFRSLDLIQHRQCTYQAVVSLLLRESRVQPVVAVFEELQWNDSLSLGLLNELVVATQDSRLLLVVCYRPEYRNQWRNRPNHHELHLGPLASDGLTEFLQVLLGSDPSLDKLKHFLAERANGNPFFVEEIVRSLIDTDVIKGEAGGYRLARPFSSTEVPPTVRAVLAARIDALPATDKRLLEEAAVIGPNIPFTLLHEICGLKDNELRGLLDDLEAAEFLYPTQLFPDLEYTFKHPLTHDVTYSGVLHERRREIHARVVEGIEKLYADRLGEQVERLAHHAVQGERQEKAVRYLRQAGAKAVVRSALPEARACFEQALGFLNSLQEDEAALESAFEIRLELRPVLRQLGEVRQMLNQLREAEALAERLKDDHRRGQVCSFMTTVLATLDELDEAVVTGIRALEIAKRREDLRLGVVATSCLEEAYYYRGEYERVVEITAEILPAVPAEWGHEFFGLALPPSVFGRAWLIMSLAELGKFAEATKYKAEAIQLAEQTQHAHTIGWAHLAASVLDLSKGDWVEARSLVDHWMSVPGTLNVAMLLPWAVASSAWVLAQAGETEEALNRVREGERLLELHAASGIAGHCSWAYQALGRACLLLGRLDEAQRLGYLSVESAHHQPGFRAHALRLLGDLATHPDQFDAECGAGHYQQALALAELHGMRPLVAHCRFGLGKLYDRIGQPEHARENTVAATCISGSRQG